MLEIIHRLCLVGLLSATASLHAQVDEELAREYFEEARTLCERDGGELWGVSLCGPMVFADAATGTIATSQEAPQDPRPRSLGYANTAIKWGDERWATYVWSMLPHDDAERRGRLLMHELFHLVQPGLGLMTSNADNSHLDTLEGRYLIQLEWRALARALGTTGEQRRAAISDARFFGPREEVSFRMRWSVNVRTRSEKVSPSTPAR